MRFKVLLLTVVLAWFGVTRAEPDADINWKMMESPHFVIFYYDDVAWTARKVAQVAEEIYPKVTGMYGHEPTQKTRIVVRDDEDTSNGFAVFNLGYITIWASPSTLSLRGRHDWIRGVVTHEFAHVISLQVSSGAGWRVEGIRFGGISNSDTKHNTDVGGSLYVPTNPYSRWWAEGTAQLDTAATGYDLWDTHQDMLLRACTLEGNLLTFDQMRNISVREHFGGELIYNQGFNFLLWLKERYGTDANLKVARKASETWNLDFDKNFEESLGKTSKELYAEWKQSLEAKYSTQVADIRKAPKEGRRIDLISPKKMKEGEPAEQPYKDGVYNFYPRFSPDGRWFSYVDKATIRLRYLDHPFIIEPFDDSNESKDSKPASLTLSFPGSGYTWAPNSKEIITSRRKANAIGAYPYYDLFRVDLSEHALARSRYLTTFYKEADAGKRKKLTKKYLSERGDTDLRPRRITKRLRATHVAWSPDGKTLAFSANQDGRRTLRVSDADGSNVKDLLAIGGDAEALFPAWSPDGTKLVITLFNHDQSDLWIVDFPSGKLRPLTLDKADDLQPVFTSDGKEVLFSSDRTGIFQIYRIPTNAAPGTPATALTNVETGAFMPATAAKGDGLLYVRFSSTGFKPYELALPANTTSLPESPPVDPSMGKEQLTEEEVPPLPPSTSYFPWPRPLRIFPTLLFENDQFKAGLGLELADFLEKHRLTASALFGEDQDYQISYTNDMFYPTIYSSYTAYIRNTPFASFNDGDTTNDDPEGLLRDNIQFVDAGISQSFRSDYFLEGTHTFSLGYDRRFVDRRVGFPTIINGVVDTSFRLLTNDGANFTWSYSKRPSSPDRDGDINPRDTLSLSATYSFVHTSLFFPDSAIPAPNQNYNHHEGTVAYYQTFSLPWTRPWWEYHSWWLRFNGGMKSRDVSALDEFYLGGRINFRAFGQISSNTLFYGYEDFSISGETLLLLATGYTFPIARALDKKWGFFYWDAVYASIFYEVGNAWNYGESKNLKQNTAILHDVGAEVKLKAFVFQDSNRWNSILRVAHGFQDNAANGFSSGDSPVRVYIGIGTDF